MLSSILSGLLCGGLIALGALAMAADPAPAPHRVNAFDCAVVVVLVGGEVEAFMPCGVTQLSFAWRET